MQCLRNRCEIFTLKQRDISKKKKKHSKTQRTEEKKELCPNKFLWLERNVPIFIM